MKVCASLGERISPPLGSARMLFQKGVDSPLNKGGARGFNELSFRLLTSEEDKMANHKNKMICPKCDDEMNHHADKLVYPASATEAENMDLALSGVIDETHCCPGCGAVASRRAA